METIKTLAVILKTVDLHWSEKFALLRQVSLQLTPRLPGTVTPGPLVTFQ